MSGGCVNNIISFTSHVSVCCQLNLNDYNSLLNTFVIGCVPSYNLVVISHIAYTVLPKVQLNMHALLANTKVTAVNIIIIFNNDYLCLHDSKKTIQISVHNLLSLLSTII